MKPENRPYGKELILDLHDCNPLTFTRKNIEVFMKTLCLAIDMKRDKLVFWDDMNVPEEEKQTSPHTKGTTAIQFILTSNITIHTLDDLKAVYINIFSCKDFDSEVASACVVMCFGGQIVHRYEVFRK